MQSGNYRQILELCGNLGWCPNYEFMIYTSFPLFLYTVSFHVSKVKTISFRITKVKIHYSVELYFDFSPLWISFRVNARLIPSWFQELIKEMDIPAIFTDFCEEAANLAASCISSVTGRPPRVPVYCYSLFYALESMVYSLDKDSITLLLLLFFADPNKSV